MEAPCPQEGAGRPLDRPLFLYHSSRAWGMTGMRELLLGRTLGFRLGPYPVPTPRDILSTVPFPWCPGPLNQLTGPAVCLVSHSARAPSE